MRRFKCFEPDLDLLALFGEETVSKGHDLDLTACSCRQKVGRGRPCFLFALTGTAKHAPVNVKANALFKPAEKCRSRTNFDVVRVRPQA